MANTAPDWTTTDLWRRLADCRLLEPHILQEQRQHLADVDDVREALKLLLGAGELTAWQANQLLAGRQDFAFGNYLLVNQVGQDDTGKHFLARHAQLGRSVLLKIVHRHLSKDKAIVQRFVQDAREAGALEHPNILHVFDVNQDRGRYFMVSEYCAGESLQALVEREGKLPSEAVVSYTMQAAEALRYAHQLGVAHQHLQASHLLLSQQVIKIADFGVGELAASLDPDAAAESPGDQAPDISLHAAQDVAALGRILLFLLGAQSPAELAEAPPIFRELCGEMLKEPWTERTTADAVHAACRRWLDDHHAAQPVSPAPYEPPPALATAPPAVHRGAVRADGGRGDAAAAKPAPPRKSPSAVPLSPAGLAVAGERSATAGGRSSISRRTQPGPLRWIMAAVVVVGGLTAVVWYMMQPPVGVTNPPTQSGGGSPNRNPHDPLGGQRNRHGNARKSQHPPLSSGQPGLTHAQEPVASSKAAASENHESEIQAAGGANTPPGNPDAGEGPDPNAANPQPTPSPEEVAAADVAAKQADVGAAGASDPAKSTQAESTQAESTQAESTRAESTLATVKDQPQPSDPPALADWPTSVSLPPLDDTKTLVLGQAPSGDWSVELLGAATATRGGLPLTIRESETDEISWRIRGEQAEVAEITRQKDQIHWRWLAGAADVAFAGHLANCVLRFRSGTKEHRLALREPLQLDPLPMKFQGRSLIAEAASPLPFPPASNAVRWRLLGITGGNAKVQLPEAGLLRLGRDEALLMVGDEQIPELLRIGIKARWRREFEVVAQVYAASGPVRRALQYDPLLVSLKALTNRVAAFKASEEELKKQRPSEEFKKRRLEAERFQIGQALQQAEVQRAAVAAMLALLEVLNENGGIQVELLLQIEDDVELTLARVE